MKFLFFVALLFTAVVVVVIGTKCHHDDTSTCININCTLDSEELGCLHDVCTCVPKPQPCLTKGDCTMVTCEKHDETPHCLDGNCVCQKGH